MRIGSLGKLQKEIKQKKTGVYKAILAKKSILKGKLFYIKQILVY